MELLLWDRCPLSCLELGPPLVQPPECTTPGTLPTMAGHPPAGLLFTAIFDTGILMQGKPVGGLQGGPTPNPGSGEVRTRAGGNRPLLFSFSVPWGQSFQKRCNVGGKTFEHKCNRQLFEVPLLDTTVLPWHVIWKLK